MVPVRRSQGLHYGRGSRSLGEFFILHSRDCLDSGIDLTTCPYSLVMRHTGLDEVFEAEYVYLLRIVNGRLDGTKGIRVTEQAPTEILDAIMDAQDDDEPIDYGAEAQRAAEDHLAACWSAFHDEEDEEGQPIESPASAPFDGCQTCEVREVLYAAYPHLEKAWEAERG